MPVTTSLEEKVRHLIRADGPQLSIEECEARVDDELERMKPADLLRYISLALGEIPCQ